MNLQADVLSRFSETGRTQPLFLPDLTLWYEFHRQRGSLPAAWQGFSLAQIARALGAPVWLPVAPWRVETLGVEIVTTERDEERIIRSKTAAGELIARWVVGPDGDWWQTEYPVKTKDDLAAVLELVNARSYVLDTSELSGWVERVGQEGILALEIPRRPYSDLLHEFLGWSEGLLFLREPIVEEINAVLDGKLQGLVKEVAKVPGRLVLSPDNLDGQFISPRAFQRYLAESYRLTTEELHRHGKQLVVHVGGPIGRLLAPLTESGVDGFEGICGPPQSDLSLVQARELVGPGPTLWGGIPQDVLLDTHEEQEFEAAVLRAIQDVRGEDRVILGVADRVPVGAELSRLQAIPDLIERAQSDRPI